MPPTDAQQRTIAIITVKLLQLGHEVLWQEPISEGPLITTYRFAPRQATKVSQIVALAQDLALALATDEPVMIRRLSGEAVLGISIPNKSRSVPMWRDTLAAPSPDMAVPLNLGVDQFGQLYRADLAKLPHLLIAGATDSGKSTLLNSLIASLLFWRPDCVQLVLSDTKGVEFGHFVGATQLLFDPATTVYQTCERMDWLIAEMERRFKLLSQCSLQNIHQLNERFSPKLPYIVLVIDEIAHIFPEDDNAQRKISGAKLSKLVSTARASGIHIIAATQHPSVKVLAGVIKSNFPSRLSFRVSSESDSRVILDSSGAEHLLSRGDMWFKSPGQQTMLRLHSAYAPSDHIRACVELSSWNGKRSQVTK